MVQETMRTCRIEQVGKQRNGHPRFWCLAHKANATGRHGAPLLECELAHTSVLVNDIFELNAQEWPGGVALWGAVPPVYNTTAKLPEVGIHVHARETIGGEKKIDHTFQAVKINYRRDLIDESEAIITSETAVNYYLSKFLNREIRHLFCIRCGEPHLDAGYYAIHPHKNHLCHGCGHIFHDSEKSISNPILLLMEQPDFPNASHTFKRSQKSLDIKQSDCLGGIQIWASNPAFLWTAHREEEEGLHVHAYDEQKNEIFNDTCGEVILDGIKLNESHIRHFMAQATLPTLDGRLTSLHCPTCNEPYFDSGDDAFEPKIKRKCKNCGADVKSTGKQRKVVSNPFIDVRNLLLGNSPANKRNLK